MNENEELEVLETEETMEDQELTSLPEVSDYSEITEDESSSDVTKYLVGGAIGSLVTVAAVKGYQKYVQPKASKAWEGLKKKVKERKNQKGKADVIDVEVEETENH